MGFLKSVGTCIVYFGTILGIITFIPGLPPEAEFREYSIERPNALKGKLGPNDRLNSAEVLHLGQLKGAESFDSFNGELYAGVHGGYVIKIDEHQIVPIIKFGKDCKGIWEEEKCGRPLGLKFDKSGNLYVIDAYYGIFKVDIKTKHYEKIIDITQPIEGKVPKLPNSIDIASNGDIYWTDSSTDFGLSQLVLSFLSNPSGRLIRYNAATGKNEVLVNGLGFANGVKLSDDESFIIVLETLKSRILKYNLKGAKAGEQEIFYQGLPGTPDNVHSDNHGGFLVSLITYIDAENPAFHETLIPHPYIRKLFARLLILLQLPFKIIQDVYPNEYAERLKHSITATEPLTAIMNTETVVVLRFNANGEIIDSAYANDGNIAGISSAFVHNYHLWLGSPFAEYVARIPLKQAFPELLKKEIPTNIKVARTKKVEEVVAVPPTHNKQDTIGKENPSLTTTTTKPQSSTPIKAQATSTTTSTTTTPKPVIKKASEHTKESSTTPVPKSTKATERPVTSTTPKPVTSTTHKTVTSTTQKPMTSTTERPVTSTTQRPVTTTTQRPMTSTTQTPVTSTTQKLLPTSEDFNKAESNMKIIKKDVQDIKLQATKKDSDTIVSSTKSTEKLTDDSKISSTSGTTDTKQDADLRTSKSTEKNDKIYSGSN